MMFNVIGKNGLFYNADGTTEQRAETAECFTAKQAKRVRALFAPDGNTIDAWPGDDSGTNEDATKNSKGCE